MGWFARGRSKREPMTPEEMLARGHANMLPAPPPAPPPSGGFRLVVEDVFFITGRGVVATGRVEGVVHIGSPVAIDRDGLRIGSAKVRSIEMFRVKDAQYATTGDNAGLLLDGITRDQVAPGDVLTP